MEKEIPQCRKCIHFFITHNPAQPYGCRALGFKSKRNPATVVYEISGIICQLYTPKQGDKGGGRKA